MWCANVRRIKSAQSRASSRGGRPSRPQGGSGADSVALASRGSTCSPSVNASVGLAAPGSTRAPAVDASVVQTSPGSTYSLAVDGAVGLASPQSVVFPNATTSDRHPSTWLGMVLSRVEGPRRPWSHPSTVLGVP